MKGFLLQNTEEVVEITSSKQLANNRTLGRRLPLTWVRIASILIGLAIIYNVYGDDIAKLMTGRMRMPVIDHWYELLMVPALAIFGFIPLIFAFVFIGGALFTEHTYYRFECRRRQVIFGYATPCNGYREETYAMRNFKSFTILEYKNDGRVSYQVRAHPPAEMKNLWGRAVGSVTLIEYEKQSEAQALLDKLNAVRGEVIFHTSASAEQTQGTLKGWNGYEILQQTDRVIEIASASLKNRAVGRRLPLSLPRLLVIVLIGLPVLYLAYSGLTCCWSKPIAHLLAALFGFVVALLFAAFIFALALLAEATYFRFDLTQNKFVYGSATVCTRYQEKIYKLSDLAPCSVHESSGGDSTSYSVMIRLPVEKSGPSKPKPKLRDFIKTRGWRTIEVDLPASMIGFSASAAAVKLADLLNEMRSKAIAAMGQ